MKKVKTGGGWAAVRYALRTARRVGGLGALYRALRSRNTCKTCALGMGGQEGGMVNERGRFPEVCKKSMQAMAADMQPGIAAEFFEKHAIDEMRDWTPRRLEHAGRLNNPVYAGPKDTHYRAISWDEAIRRSTDYLRQSRPTDHFFYFSGRASNEAAFLWQLFARLYGTNHVNNCSYYCHQASGVGLSSALGSGTSTVVLEDLDHCDTVFLIGGNPASNHPRLMGVLADVRRRGGEVVVMNPLRETGLVNFSVPSRVESLLFGTDIASHYLQPNIGGDIALLCGVAKRLIETNAVDHGYIDAFTEGYDVFRASLEALEWETIETESGVERRTIEEIADVYGRSKASVFAWTMGITHHLHGADNVRAIVNLALLRGMVGREHAGLLPIRGHSNVQGVGSMGVTPQLKDEVLRRLESHFGVKVPAVKGLDTLGCIEAMQRGELKHAWCLGGNLFGSNPDSAATERAFGQLESVVYLSTTLNTGHVHGRAGETLVLPVRARDEEPQATTQESMFNYVRMSDGGPARMPGSRSEVEIVAELAESVLGDGGPVDWNAMRRHRNIRRAIAAIIPGFEAIGRIDDTRQEFQIEGRTYHEPRFKTPSGRAKFHVTPIPRFDPVDGALRMMTIRSEGQFNTVVYEEEDLYRGQDRRDIILLNADDMRIMGLDEDTLVLVKSDTGSMTDIRARQAPIRAGNAAMYYPEANVLISRACDAESRTPAFKHVRVWVSRV
ncbi:MAG: FdhF/YdeP family oxidoreductase [Phycisphaerales bacterium]|nr:FdhF/YdeP family oxidoreductase [Phycisphaerales bacterium]